MLKALEKKKKLSCVDASRVHSEDRCFEAESLFFPGTSDLEKKSDARSQAGRCSLEMHEKTRRIIFDEVSGRWVFGSMVGMAD